MPPAFLLLLLWALQSTTLLLGTMQVPGAMHDVTTSGNQMLLPSTYETKLPFLESALGKRQ